MTDADLRTAFRALHRRGDPLVLPNVWDAGSAKAVAEAGATALATSSWAVAAAHGFDDGEQVPFSLVVENLSRISAASDLPMTIDFERGYGETPAEVRASLGRLLTTGAVGCNLEDGASTGGVRPVEDQAARIGAVRSAADTGVPGFFINARTDLFLQSAPEQHSDRQLIVEAIERAHAYRQAGADGFFVPGLTDLAVLRTLVEAVSLPINVMAGDEAVAAYAEAGVARISFGPLSYLQSIGALRDFAGRRLQRAQDGHDQQQ